MKKNILKVLIFVIILSCCFTASILDAGVSEKLEGNAEEALRLFKKKDPHLKRFFDNSHGYAIYPKVAKGGIGIGGATGKGVVYEKDKMIGSSRLIQVNVGLQLGGQVYSEIVFFESKKDLDKFKRGKLKLSAQVSAVAAASGVSANAKYSHGVAIFTIARGGLMYEATVGGQKFSYKPLYR